MQEKRTQHAGAARKRFHMASRVIESLHEWARDHPRFWRLHRRKSLPMRPMPTFVQTPPHFSRQTDRTSLRTVAG